MDQSERPDTNKPHAAQLNAAIFVKLMGARRVRLPGDLCGYEFEGRQYACFPGNERFEDEPSWAEFYGGPDFAADLNWCHRAEAVVRERGLGPDYVAALLRRVFPTWETIDSDDEVVRFWFALTHASAADRAAALAEVATECLSPARNVPRRRQS